MRYCYNCCTSWQDTDLTCPVCGSPTSEVKNGPVHYVEPQKKSKAGWIGLVLVVCLVLGMVLGTLGIRKYMGSTEEAHRLDMPESNWGEDLDDAITLEVWAGEADQEGENSWLVQMQKAYAEDHPELTIHWSNSICDTTSSANTVSQDPQAAADVYLYISDMLGTLMQCNGAQPLEGVAVRQVLADNYDAVVQSVAGLDGRLYGFPIGANTWYLYYNKRVFSEKDVKSLESMLKKGDVAFPWRTPWYGGTFFLAAGGEMFGADGNDPAAGIQFGADNGGYEAAKRMVELANNSNMHSDDNGLGLSGMMDGSVAAYFSGTWEYDRLYQALGEDLGVATLPTVKINGSQRQMKAFVASEVVGVNPHGRNVQIAMDFAAFLASAESQKLRFQLQRAVPVAKALQQDEQVKAYAPAVAQMETLKSAAVFQPYYAEMGKYWGAMGDFGSMVCEGIITKKNYKDYVDVLMDGLNG